MTLQAYADENWHAITAYPDDVLLVTSLAHCFSL